MFIQRLSGPTIGFYCLDLFEVTYSTYASVSYLLVKEICNFDKLLFTKSRNNCLTLDLKIYISDYCGSWTKFPADC